MCETAAFRIECSFLPSIGSHIADLSMVSGTSSPMRASRFQPTRLLYPVTFGEMVSSFDKSGNVAAKRHSHMIYAQQTRFCDRDCTIKDKVAVVRQSRASELDRSLTPSPRQSRRHSLPAGPHHYPRLPGPRREAFEPIEGVLDVLPGTGRTSATSTSSRSPQRSCTGGTYDAVARGSARSWDEAPASYSGNSFRSSSPWREVVRAGAAQPTGELSARMQHAPTQPQPRPSPNRASGYAHGHTSWPEPVAPQLHAYSSEIGDRTVASPVRPLSRSAPWAQDMPPQLGISPAPDRPCRETRAGSFVRLNGFLWRTHITSLIAALTEDGWMEVHEKERICSLARQDRPSWASSFMKVYTRFMETEDVFRFVADLRALSV
mmetsp:Transcript_5879/g.14033  ORF Transcript_5879/g.14033 Transcript_5879/m.14033 type:complete len:377 (-) Transcript_5879:103-1233(-)